MPQTEDRSSLQEPVIRLVLSCSAMQHEPYPRKTPIPKQKAKLTANPWLCPPVVPLRGFLCNDDD